VAQWAYGECLTLAVAREGVSKVERKRHGGRCAERGAIRSMRGPNTPHRAARRLLPPDRERRARNLAVLRRGRLSGVHRAPHAGLEALGTRAPRLLPDGDALPRTRRRPDRRPLAGHAVDPEPLRQGAQRPVRSQGSALPPAVLLLGRPRRGALREHARLHPRQPGARRPRRAPRGLAVERRPTRKRTSVRP
jgi:hypothetical protein